MVQSIYLLAVLAICRLTASTSAHGEDKAEGAIKIPTYLPVAHANIPIVETDVDSSLQFSQQVMLSGGELGDHQTPPQHPEILIQGRNAITPMPTELAIYKGPQAPATTAEPKGSSLTSWNMDFWGQRLGEALELAKIKANEMGLKQVATTAEPKGLDLTGWDMHFWGQSLGEALEMAKIKANEMDLKQVAKDIEAWVEKHPWKAGFYAASALGFFAPEIFSIAALEALGFGAAGVRAGSIASKLQSTIGPIAARSVFAIWQSARMGGYGVANVNGGVRAVIALADAAAAKCDLFKDCKGLISDAGSRLRSATSTRAMAVACGCLIGLNTVF